MLLSPPTPADARDLFALQSDPRVWRHFPSGRATSHEQTRTWGLSLMADWETTGVGVWVARDAQDGRFLGYGGCTLRHGGAYWNLGYRFRPEEQGRGLATELSRAAVAAARESAAAVPVVAHLLEHNLASAAVARKLGLELAWRGPDAGNPDPDAVRLIFADRPLTAGQLAAARH